MEAVGGTCYVHWKGICVKFSCMRKCALLDMFFP
jgi:hypothetical protein